MDPVTISLLSIGAALLLLFLGVPVAFALAAVGFAGYSLMVGVGPAFSLLGIIPYGSIAKYTFTVIPLFLLMGSVAHKAGFGSDIFGVARLWLGRLPGGLAHATVLGCAAFGAISGSGIATAAMMGRVAIPEMLRYGYDRKLALGTVAAAGTLAQMIPPSILMVIYAVITEQPVGKLLIAGIIPGLIAAANFMIFIVWWTRLHPNLAPAAEAVSWGERLRSLRHTWSIILMATIVMGGIYTGVFTPTEAGGVAACSAIILGFASRRLSLKGLGQALDDSTRTTGMLFLIMVGAYIFGAMLSVSRTPVLVSNYLTSLPLPPYGILLLIVLMYLVLGLFLDNIASMFLTLPIIFPTVKALGFDPIWFGILLVHLMEVALITPPYGLNLFVLKGVVPDATMGEIIRGVGWFVLADLVTLAIFILFPEVVLFLPTRMGF